MLRSGSASEKARFLLAVVTRVDLFEEKIELTIDQSQLSQAMGLEAIADRAEQPLVLVLAATRPGVAISCG